MIKRLREQQYKVEYIKPLQSKIIGWDEAVMSSKYRIR